MTMVFPTLELNSTLTNRSFNTLARKMVCLMTTR